MEGVQEAAVEVLQGFAGALQSNELELTFGLKFGAEAEAPFASVDSKATIVLKTKWVKSATR